MVNDAVDQPKLRSHDYSFTIRNLRIPVPEVQFGSWIRGHILIQVKSLGALSRTSVLEVVSSKNPREHDFDFRRREVSARTRLFAVPKGEVLFPCLHPHVMVLLAGELPLAVRAEGIENRGIGRDFFVHEDGGRGKGDTGSAGDVCAVLEVDALHGDALGRHWISVSGICSM